MFARLTYVHIKREKIDDCIEIYENSVIPAARLQKGYQGAYLLVDRKTGKAISITLWNSEEDAIANEDNRYYQEQVLKFRVFFTKPPIREGYEVSVQA